jgi:hypothetical protein
MYAVYGLQHQQILLHANFNSLLIIALKKEKLKKKIKTKNGSLFS